MKGKIIFEEQQMFRYSWSYWLLVTCTAPIAIGGLFGIYQQIILGQPLGDKPLNDTGLIIGTSLTLILVIGLILLFHFMVLKVYVDHSQINYSFFPFVRKTKSIGKSDIEKLEVRKYNPIWEYGGWGYRTRLGNGEAMNVKGNKGLQIKFKDGKKLLLGTQKSEELEEAVNTLQKNWRNQHG